MPQSDFSASLIGQAASASNIFPVGAGYSWQGQAASNQGFQSLLDEAFHSSEPAVEPEPARSDAESAAASDRRDAVDADREASAVEGGEPAPVAVVVPVVWNELLPVAQQAPTLNLGGGGVEQGVPVLVTAPLAALANVMQRSESAPTATNVVQTSDQLPDFSAVLNQGQQVVVASEAVVVQTPLVTAPLTGLVSAQGDAVMRGNLQDGAIQAAVTPFDAFYGGGLAQQVEQVRQEVPWSSVTMGGEGELVLRDRVAVMPVGEGVRLPEVVLSERGSVGVAGPVVQEVPEAGVPAAAAVTSGVEAVGGLVNGGGNGFTNGFVSTGSVMQAVGMPVAGGGGISTPSTSASRVVLSGTVTEFPEMVASELGRTRIVTRPNQAEQIRIQLEPRELGGLDMQVRVDRDRQVHLTILTEFEGARDLLQQQMGQLRDALAVQDMTCGEVRIDVGARGSQGESWRSARQREGSGRMSVMSDGDRSEVSTVPVGGVGTRPRAWTPGSAFSIHV